MRSLFKAFAAHFRGKSDPAHGCIRHSRSLKAFTAVLLRHAILIGVVLLVFLALTTKAGFSRGKAERNEDAQDLSQLSLSQLANMEFTSTTKRPEALRKTPAAVYVITEDEIRRSGATSIPELLRLVPGVEVARISSDQWSMGIRGFASRLSRSMLVLIDGRSVYSPLFAGVYWEIQDVPLADIDRIEVIRGPGGTVWGANAVNGVINIITKNSRETHGALATVGGGNVDQGTEGIRYGGGTENGLNYRIYAKGFTRGPEFHTNSPAFDDWRMGQTGFRMDWKSKRGDDFALEGDLYAGLTGERLSLGSFSPPYSTIVDANADVSGGNLLGRWKRTISEKSDLELKTYYDRTNRYEPDFGETRDTFDIDLVHHLVLPRNNSFLWGVGARLSSGNFIQQIPTTDFLPHHKVDKLFSAFAEDEIPLKSDQLRLTVGTKLEHNNYSGFEIQPNARLLWTPNSNQTLWAAVTRAVRTPSRLEADVQLGGVLSLSPLTYFALAGNPDFASEELVGYEAGYRGLITPNFYVDVALFHNQYDRLLSISLAQGAVSLETSPPPTHFLLTIPLENGLKGRTDGFEIAPDWRPRKWWQLKGSYSYLHIDLKNRPGSQDNSSAISQEGSSPRHQVVAQSFLNLSPKIEFSQTFRYVSGLPALNVRDYSTGDLRFGWHITPAMEFSVVGTNLMQPHHQESAGPAGAVIEIKRGVYAQITLQWKQENSSHE